MRSLGLPGVEICSEPVTKCGITGTKIHVFVNGDEEPAAGSASNSHIVSVNRHVHRHTHEQPHEHEHERTHEQQHNHTHGHYSYNDIRELISTLDLAENVREKALEVYRLIGEAESAVHGVPLDEIQFHEVGSMDAVADIVGCCLLFHMLGVDRIDASPVHVGSGFVKTEHGILPVPAPATAHILKGVPIYGGQIKGELCTPTGAALLRVFVSRFGDMEPMAVSSIGYGMGTRDFEAANCVRAYLSEHTKANQTVVEISCNLDDMTPEAVGYTTQLLMDSGALDVFTTPITMKKNRPAVLLTCLCSPEDKNAIARLMLKHTSTLGLRYQTMRRDVLAHTVYTISTPFGDIRIKSAEGYGVYKEKPEYEDVKNASDEHGVPFSQVYAAAVSAMNSTRASNDP